MDIFTLRFLIMVTACFSMLLGSTPSYAGLNEWTVLGAEGGYISTIAEDPFSPSTVLAGTLEGGIFRSTDGGISWSPANGNLSATDIYTIVFDPLTPATLFVGTGGYGLFKSTDSGNTWTELNAGMPSTYVLSIAIDPRNPSIIYAGTANGIAKSANGGIYWTVLSNGIPTSRNHITCIAIDPYIPSTIYAASETDALFKSTDGGLSWVRINAGIPDTYVPAVTIQPNNPSILFAAASSGVFRSTDAGSSWSLLPLGAEWTLPRNIAIDPHSPSTIYAATYYGGLYKSVDGGNSWVYSAFGTGMRINMLNITASSHRPSTLYAGMRGTGIFISVDAGTSWVDANHGLINTSITNMAIDPVNNATLYAIDFYKGLMKSTDGGNNWVWLSTLVNYGINDIVVDPKVPATVYAGATYTLWKSLDGGSTWDIMMSGTGNPNVFSVAVNPVNTQIIYTGTSRGIYKSTNGGISWHHMNSDLLTTWRGDMVIDPVTPTTIYIATDKGIYKSADSGISWVSINFGLTGDHFHKLAIDPLNPSRLFTASYGSGVFVSTDGGNMWTKSHIGLTNNLVLSLTIDPEGTVVLAGTDGGGVFKSHDYGSTWIPMNDGLVDHRIQDIKIDPVDPSLIYVGTRGRGVSWFQRTLPATPTQLVAKAISSSRIALTWQYPAANETGFSLLRKKGRCAKPGSWTTIKALPADTTTFVDSHLAAQTTYSYKIRAYNADGYSLLSPCTDTKTSFEGTPMAPTELIATGDNSSRVSLRWKNNANTDSTIQIFRKKGDNPAELFRIGSGFLSSYIDMSADGNDALTEYSYFLRSCNTVGCSPDTFQATIPFKPGRVKLAPSSGLVNISWEDESYDETAFQIWRKDGTCDSTNNWSRIKTTTADVMSAIDAVPAPGLYAYRLRSVARSRAIPYAVGHSVFTDCKNVTVP